MTQGERVREIRKSLGLTLEKFGEKLGVKKNAISQTETGRNSLTDQMTKAICRDLVTCANISERIFYREFY